MWRNTAQVVVNASKTCSKASAEVLRLKQQMVNALEDQLVVAKADSDRPTTPPMREFTATLRSESLMRIARENKEDAIYHCVLLNQQEL